MTIINISLPSFTLEKVDFFSENNILYINGLVEDEDVRKFLPYFKSGLYISKSIGLLNSHYVVSRNQEKIGYVFFSSPFSEEMRLNAEIRYIVDPKYRNQGLGKKIVEESSDFILKQENIDGLKAYIHPDNQASLQVISHAGFQATGEDLDGIAFSKPKSRK